MISERLLFLLMRLLVSVCLIILLCQSIFVGLVCSVSEYRLWDFFGVCLFWLCCWCCTWWVCFWLWGRVGVVDLVWVCYSGAWSKVL